MNYRRMESTGDTLSLLGYGCMRFPRKAGVLDEPRARRQVLSAVEQGVNYFDTAYLYPGSERALGNILAEEGLREKVKLADKLPHILVKGPADLPALLQKQLDRLRTSYIDYYLVHNIGSFADWERLKGMGICEFIREQKALGRIRHFGFSFHGNLLTFRQLVDDYPWEFCQIQYNYLDENFQAGTKGLEYAAEKGLGVVVMEPLRGGTLGAKMPAQAQKALHRHGESRSPAEWALRWVFSHPQVHVVLSGMNEEEHIAENIRAASAQGGYAPTQAETEAIARVRESFARLLKVPCTACAYCMPCPHGVDIPTCFSHYNNRAVQGAVFSTAMYIQATLGAVNGKPTKASLCTGCGACVKHCPQQIEIPERLREAARAMEKPWITLPIQAAMKLMRR